ncbi:Uncharacterised protein [Salmonella enterica subsp. arizonae]|uniref:Uncharacterized protein n=1 Tax=Salmonella enterica subsp. arizonae TaxID=59203 RepID=A0A379RZ23_SALER|nr:Uncharacterised protein [Salmonella enterica subsp. arizonae]
MNGIAVSFQDKIIFPLRVIFHHCQTVGGEQTRFNLYERHANFSNCAEESVSGCCRTTQAAFSKQSGDGCDPLKRQYVLSAGSN